MKLKHLSIFALSIMLLSNCGEKAGKKEAEKTDEKSEKTEKKSDENVSQKSDEKEEKKSEETNKAVVTAKNGLSLRESSDRKSKLVTVLPSSAIVEIVEKGTEEMSIGSKKAPFHKVKYGKYEGYAFAAYLKTGQKIEVSNNANAKTATENTEKTDFSSVIQKGLVVAKSGLTLREKPDAKSKSLGIIPKNQEIGVIEFLDKFVEIGGISGDWCKVRYGKKEGYLFSGFINFSIAKVKAKSGLKLRKDPNTDGEQITVIPSGADVYMIFTPATDDNAENTDVIDDGTGHLWYKVRYGKYEGYAYGEFLEIEAGC